MDDSPRGSDRDPRKGAREPAQELPGSQRRQRHRRERLELCGWVGLQVDGAATERKRPGLVTTNEVAT